MTDGQKETVNTTTGKECQKSNHVGKKTNSSSNSNGSKVENGNAGGEGEWGRKRGERCELAKLISG